MRSRILNPYNVGSNAPTRRGESPQSSQLVPVRMTRPGSYFRRSYEAGEVVHVSPEVARILVEHGDADLVEKRSAPTVNSVRYRGGPR